MHIWENVNATVLYDFHILGYVDNTTIVHIKILIYIKQIIRTEQQFEIKIIIFRKKSMEV